MDHFILWKLYSILQILDALNAKKTLVFLNSSLINVLGEHNCKGKYIANAKYLKYFKKV